MTKAQHLTAYLSAPLPPFDWRAANCGHFIAGYVARVEGRDPVAEFPHAAGLAATRRTLRRLGGLLAATSAHLQREPITPTLAQLGDVVLLPLSADDPEAQALGLCCGEVAACRDEQGAVLMLPMAAALAAWRVGA